MIRRVGGIPGAGIVGAALLTSALSAGPARAANLQVTTVADGGAGSLRQVLTTAEGNGEGDVVTITVNGTINVLTTLPTITTDVEIQGPGAGLLTINGGDSVRVFRIEGGTVAIRDLTVAGGFARGGDGEDAPGNRGGGGGGGLGAGGGVYSENADLTLDSVVFDGNIARGGDGGDGGSGCNGCLPGAAGTGGTSSLGASGGSPAGTTGNGGGGGGAGAGFTDGGNGGAGNAGGGAGIGGSRMLVAGLSDVGNGSGGSGGGCGGGSPTFQIAGDFAGGGGHGIVNCLGSGGGGGGGAGLGGALYLRSGTLTLDGVTFDDNEAHRGPGAAGGSGGGDGQGKGGALFVDRDGVVVAITPPVFIDNQADDDLGTCDDNDDLYNRGTYPQEPPTGLALSSLSVPENQPTGTAVGTFTTTDPTSGDTHTYALVAGAGSTHNGQFTIVGDELQTAAVFDHETQPTRSIRVRTTDACGGSFESVFTITVTDVNEPPTGLLLSPAAVDENQPPPAAVGAFSTPDPDLGDPHVYTLVAGAGSTNNGEFTISGNALATAVSFDHETQPTRSIRVRTTDGGGLFVESQFTITVNDVNEPPSLPPTSFTVPEDAGTGTVVGTVTATDPDAGTVLTYMIEAGDPGGAFAIGSASGEITVAGPLDHETIPSYSLTVRATDDAAPPLFGEATVTIDVTDVNEAPSAGDDAFATGEDEPLAVVAPGVLGNDGDPDGDVLTVVAHDPASAEGAAVTVAADGSFQYDPTAAPALQALGDGDSVLDTFGYTAADPGGLEASAVVEVTVSGASSGLTLTKEALTAGGSVPIGATVVYRLTVANSGPGVEAAVAVTDPLPAEVEFYDSACASPAGSTVTWDPGDLAAGAGASCEVEVTVVDRGTVVNTAFAGSLDLPEGELEATATFEGGGVIEIPTLSWPALLLLAALLAGLSWRRLGAGRA